MFDKIFTMTQAVLFLCTGNYFRSRFAEIFFNHCQAKLGIGWHASSRGLALELLGYDAGPISQHTLRGLQARGIYIGANIRDPIRLEEADLRNAAHVVALKEAEHRPLLEWRFPRWLDRVEFWHVHDIDVVPPEQALAEIEYEVHALLSRLDPRIDGLATGLIGVSG